MQSPRASRGSQAGPSRVLQDRTRGGAMPRGQGLGFLSTCGRGCSGLGVVGAGRGPRRLPRRPPGRC